jgi:serine/threonine protein kinase
MAMMFGRFEIQSEISKSETALIYKALDTESNQVVALKTQSLERLGDRSASFVQTLVAEGEQAAALAGQNIAVLYGAGEIEGQFCAAMEYVQGNSIATMLARKEGFSIWDLLDITRQVCAALDQAASTGVVHSSLEPDKILVQWDGLVKILDYGISNMSMIEAELGNGLGRLMPYCSPEQIRGEAMDQRSNVFTVGAILYEMVASRKAFDAVDPVALVGQIENEMPAEPGRVNPKVNSAVSAVIMKALAKDPAERYQTAHELVEDLEKCKENKKETADVKKTAATTVKVDAAARQAAASKFVSAAATASESAVSSRTPNKSAVNTNVPAKPSGSVPSKPEASSTRQTMPVVQSAKAAAGASGTGFSRSVADVMQSPSSVTKPVAQATGVAASSGARLIEDLSANTNADSGDSYHAPSPVMSAAAVEEESEANSPSVAVDPMMAGAAASRPAVSFSDLDELPPLKESVYVPPSIPAPEQQSHPVVNQVYPPKEEKPKIQPREVAQKAMKEISTIPPKLVLFSILGAVAIIMVVAVAVFFHVHSEDDGSTAAPRAIKTTNASPASATTTTAPAPQAAAPVQTTPAPSQAVQPPVADEQPTLTVRKADKHAAKGRRNAPQPAPQTVASAGEALIDSSPAGAQFQVDGRSDPAWVTPFSVAGLSPGKHIVSASKSGYTAEVRSVDVVAGAKASLSFHLAPINALVVVSSNPAGAEISLDGKPTGRVTPAQFAVEKGSHTVLVKKQGFLDETTTVDLGAGQNFQYAPALKALGNVEDIQTVGKFKKLFGNGGQNSTAGMGSVSVHTQPKGAQVVINQRILDKMSPLEVMMGPGNYVVDITLTGFKPVHKVVTVEKGGKVAIDEILERQ